MNTSVPVSAAAQNLIESLAEQLKRSVALVDPMIIPLYVSRHYGDHDPARIQSMLQREPSADIRRHIFDHGVTGWRHPAVLEGNPELGLKPRFCVPLHGPGWLIGVLMIVADEDRHFTDDEIHNITSTGETLSARLYADSLTADAGMLRSAQRLRQMLDPSDPGHSSAIVNEREKEVVPDLYAVVSAIQVRRSHSGGIPAETALTIAVDSATRRGRKNRAFYVDVESDTALAVVLDTYPRPPSNAESRAMCDTVLAEIKRLSGPSAVAAVGIGHSDGGIEQAWEAHDHARTALRAALRKSSASAVIVWRELGIEALLLEIPNSALRWTLVPPALRALIQHDRNGKLIETLRAYLDNAGSVLHTAEALHLHRTSLYYRLDQIRKVTGANLDDGGDRLVLHAGLHLVALLDETG